MNPILHFSLKEARYGYRRWLIWLALLAVHLLLAWRMPEQAGDALKWLWFVALAMVLALNPPPEDSPLKAHRFSATRPLSMAQFWWSRVLLFFVAAVLPLALHEGIYLSLEQRPWEEVGLGMVERAAWVTVLFGWLMPVGAMSRSATQMVVLIGAVFLLMVGLLMVGTKLVGEKLMQGTTDALVGLPSWWSFEGRLRNTGLMLLGLIAMAWFNHLGGWSFIRRVFTMVMWLVVASALVCFWPMQARVERSEDEARAQELAGSLKIESSPLALRASSDHYFQANMHHGIGLLPAGVGVEMRPMRCVATAGGKPTKPPSVTNGRWIFSDVSVNPGLHPLNGLKLLFPDGTLFHQGAVRGTAVQPTFEPPFASFNKSEISADALIRCTATYELDWSEREIIAEMPIIEGTTVRGRDVELHLSAIRLDQKEVSDEPAPGALALDLLIAHRDLGDQLMCTQLLLHSPKRKIVWLLDGRLKLGSDLTLHTGWRKALISVAVPKVLSEHLAREKGLPLADLRLLVLRKHHLGTTEWTWQAPEFRFRDYDRRELIAAAVAAFSGREVEVVRMRLAQLHAPTADSSLAEVKRYVYDVCALARHTQASLIDEADKLIGEALRPVAAHHLPVFLELPQTAMPNGQAYAVLEAAITEAHRDQVMRLLPTHSWLERVAEKRGWLVDKSALVQSMVNYPRVHGPSEMAMMLRWNDPALRERLIKDVTVEPEVAVIEKLCAFPELRPQMEALSARLLGASPLIASLRMDTFVPLRVGAAMGNREAFDLLLRTARSWDPFAAWRSDAQEELRMHQLFGLTKPRGAYSTAWLPLLELMREHRADEFTYDANTLTWRLKP
jgi:hypothetical protein